MKKWLVITEAEKSHSLICKLETQESQRCVQSLKDWGWKYPFQRRR